MICAFWTGQKMKKDLNPENDDVFLNEKTCSLVEGARAFENTC
jgi:hypothetical protein